MVNASTFHTYQKHACLQVFLYSDIDSLLEDAASELVNLHENDAGLVIVQSSAVQQVLEKKIAGKSGASGFICMNTLPNLLKVLLKKKYPDFEKTLYTKTSLSLALLELFEKDPKIKEIFTAPCKQEASSEFKLDWAGKIAGELLSVDSLSEIQETPGGKELLAGLKELYPHFLLPLDAFNELHEFYDQMIWVGFEWITPEMLKKLKTSNAKMYILVPSSIFLGDIMTPKERLKQMLKAKKGENLDLEQPLLERFTRAYQEIYNTLIDEAIDFELIETAHLKNTALGCLQESLDQGRFCDRLYQDTSLQVGKFLSPYSECRWALDTLQKFYEKNPEITVSDVVFVSSDPTLYSSILNGLGQTLESPISFSACETEERQTAWIQKLFLPEKLGRDPLYFSEMALLAREWIDLEKEDLYFKLYDLFSKAHFYAVNEQTGSAFLKALRVQVSKSWFFDLEPKEIPFEEGLMEAALDQEDFEKGILLLSEWTAFFEKVEKCQDKKQSLKEWIIEFLNLANDPFFERLNLKQPLSNAMHRLFELRHFKTEITLVDFFNLKLLEMKNETRQEGSGFKVYSLDKRPPYRPELIFFLGMTPQKESQNPPVFFSPKISEKEKKKIAWPLWIRRAKQGLFLSYSEGFLSRTEEGFHPWIEGLFRCVQQKSLELSLPLHRFNPKSRNALVQEEATPANLEEGTYLLETALLKKYLKDEETFIKGSLLQISNASIKTDPDLEDFSLMQWKMRQKGLHSTRGLYGYGKSEDEDEKEYFFRSSFAEKEDHLGALSILPPLELKLDGITLHLVGQSDVDFEKGLLKKKDKILKLVYWLKAFNRLEKA